MRILFVTPNSSGSGEAITAMHMGLGLARSGHEVRFFADPFTSRFLAQEFAEKVNEFSDDPRETVAEWHSALDNFKPRVVVFADYPLLFLSRRARVLLNRENWQVLDDLGVELVTLDHLGMAQGPLTLSFGPPHLELFPEHLPKLPQRMKVLLPCPLQRPVQISAVRGIPFRCWDVPLILSEARRKEIRGQFLQFSDELLVFHSVPSWAIEFCRRHGLTNYAYLTRLFQTFFTALPRAVTLISVNAGSQLPPHAGAGFRVVALGQLQPAEYDEFLLASDLMITDNRISVSLGKAVCGLIPCAVLRNSYRLPEILDRADADVQAIVLNLERDRMGAVFPYEAFPIWSQNDLNGLGLFSENPILECMALVEIYGGGETRQTLERLLTDAACREQMKDRQQNYVDMVGRLPTGGEALLSILG